jgi:hypothetical protein
VAKRKSKHPPVAAPETIKAYDQAVSRVEVKAVEIQPSKTGRIIREVTRSSAILDTPGPWEQPWLNQHGLQVVYKHGQAVLAFKK